MHLYVLHTYLFCGSLSTRLQNYVKNQIENLCKQQIKICKNNDFFLTPSNGLENIVGKGYLPALSSFPLMFLNAFFIMIIKNGDYVVKRLW